MKAAEERVPVIQRILTNVYDKLWIDMVEPENKDGAEARLVNALEFFVNIKGDQDMLKVYRTFRSTEEIVFMSAVHGKERYKVLQKKESEIQAFALSIQQEYATLGNEGPEGVKKLNEISKSLLPKVQAFQEKMNGMTIEKREDYTANISLEEIAPIVRFRTLQDILSHLANGGTHGHSHCCNNSHCEGH